jgi:2-polyprenyl-6-methoxyphenol hydroxylase-like FAD-dependent oxidoreductase
LLQGGYFMTLGDDGSSLFCYRQPGSIHVSYVVHAASDAELETQPPAALLQSLQQATRTWHTPIPEIAAAIDPSTIVVYGYYDKEPTQRVREGRLWLIGDAAHPMCPFQGQGANMAMVDALKLAEYFATLATAPAQGEAQAVALEADIVRRGRKAVLASRHAAERFHTTSRWQQQWRDLGFRAGSFFIGLGGRGRATAPHDR